MIVPLEKHVPEISVVIPVYKVEKYVGRCLSSLVGQTFRDFEIIAVNDGSPDDSPEILHHFAQRYGYIHVIDQANGGMSKARNTGMAAARGKYIAFVDSDDYVAPTYLEELYRACEDNGADIACCYYYFHFIENNFLFEYPFRCKGVFTREQAMDRLLRDVQIQSLVWNKLYRRSLFADNGITFPSMCFEDMATANRVFAHANRVVVLDRPLYYYNQRPSSTLATINANKINDFIRAIAMVRISLEKNGLFEKYRKSYNALVRKTCGCCYLYVLKLHSEKKCMKGCMANMRRVSKALKHYSADEFASPALFGRLPDVVASPEKLEKDYSVR
ncbi:MAG TPA: glycosyl transferase family 2 [Ruminococcaceae bacterium]|jgi:glycosyltransferase involved in cell wall biosynthesis|nr:glycosyl transferase family 2 [Oscillospiraceae bacterium]HBQ46960.1 glycosyl transferase family 2 [Oscillospiraceae bacterium]HCB91913.1 glycosyl transferase family 2 [Oscillospiraceae bacterium]